MSRSFRARALTVPLAIVAALTLVVTTAWAHVTLQRSAPSAGVTIESSPAEIRLWFSGAAQLSLTSIALAGVDGASIPLGPVAEEGDRAGSVMLARVLDVLKPGVYTVTWQTAAADGHPVRGTFTFTVAASDDGSAPIDGLAPSMSIDTAGANAAASESSRAFERVLAAVARWMAYAGTLALVGAVVIGWLLVPPPRRPDDDPEVWKSIALRAAVIGAIGAVLLLAGALGRLLTDGLALLPPGATLGGGGLGTLLGTGFGRGWALQMGSAVVAAFAFIFTARGRALWTLAAVAALAAVVAPALAGHSVTVEPRWLGIGLNFAHVLTAGLWIGSLLVLVTAALPLLARMPATRRGADAFAIVSAFSRIALAGAAILGVTGVILAWTQLAAVGDLWRSDYGRTLLIKLAFVALVLAFGAWNWRRERPRLATDGMGVARLRRSGSVELVLAAIVLAITTVLVITSPPVRQSPEAPPPEQPANAGVPSRYPPGS